MPKIAKYKRLQLTALKYLEKTEPKPNHNRKQTEPKPKANLRARANGIWKYILSHSIYYGI